MRPPASEITRLLEAWSDNDPEAIDKLMPLVFDEVRDLAAKCFAGESPGHTLQPTALASEVYLRLTGRRPVQFDNRRQFFGFLAGLMRHILVDHARRRQTAKRGGGSRKLSLDEVADPLQTRSPEVIALDDVLTSLSALDPRQSLVVELRFFMGFTLVEIADILEVSPTTVSREWRVAKLWLRQQLSPS